MKAIVIATVLVFFTACAGPLWAQDAGAPKIKVKELAYDFGKVTQGTQASHIFEVGNAGNEVLVIERVQSS